jgi:hypothetical protein
MAEKSSLGIRASSETAIGSLRRRDVGGPSIGKLRVRVGAGQVRTLR